MNRIESSTDFGYRGTLRPLREVADLEMRWRELEADADGSFFLSWSWIGAWLQIVADRAELFIYECHRRDALVALAIVNIGSVKRRLFFRSTTLTINEVSQPHLDMFIEYNGVLTRRGHESSALHQFAQDMQSMHPGWDELRLTNISREAYQALGAERPRVKKILDGEQTVWAAALDQATDLDTLFSRMSKNRRWQIRRSFKEYQKEGELTLQTAADRDEAQHFFLQMGVLHTRRWNRSGKSGSFAQADWVRFHQQLIETAFDRGEIQLLRIRCGERDIGYIYNFLWRGSVLMLQSGFASETSNLLRPGFISHMLAMQLNARLGANEYDFMVGDAAYKQSLGVAKSALFSVRLQRRRLKFSIENALIAVYRAIRHKPLFGNSLNPSTKIPNKMAAYLTCASCSEIFPALFDCYSLI